MIGAERIAQALGGKRAGSGWMAHCPSHDDKTPSLAINQGREGKLLLCCHAGCGFNDILLALINKGLWSGDRLSGPSHPTSFKPEPSAAERKAWASQLWEESLPAPKSLVQKYLRSRAITIPIPATLRFHARLRHTPSRRHWPGMVGMIADALSGEPRAIHRTYLAHDGTGKAPVDKKHQKMMLGPYRGGVVRLAEAGDTLAIAEGIETSLSVQQLTGLPVWAALSATNMDALELPDHIETVEIYADGDAVGIAAARSLARSLKRGGKSARLHIAPPNRDFNDVLRGKALIHEN